MQKPLINEGESANNSALEVGRAMLDFSLRVSSAIDQESLFSALTHVLPNLLPARGVEAVFHTKLQLNSPGLRYSYTSQGEYPPSPPESAREWLMSRPGVTAYPLDELRSLLFCPLQFRSSHLGYFSILINDNLACFSEILQTNLNLISVQLSLALQSLHFDSRLTEQFAQTRSTKDLLQGVLASVNQGVFALDKGLQVRYANAAGLEILGKPAFLVTGNYFTSAFPQPISLWISERLPALQQGLPISPTPIEIPSQSDTVQPIELQATPLVENNAYNGLVLVIRSLNQYRELARLKEMDRMKDEIISMVSHEIRTPLTSIIAFADALIQGIFDNPEQQRGALQTLQNEALRLAAIVNDFLDLAKIRAGKMEYTFGKHNATEICSLAVKSMQATALEKNISIEVESNSTQCLFFCDARRIQQVVVNLLSNAIKFSNESGRVLVKIYQLQDKLQIAVQDWGCGIDNSALSHIFDPFYQAEAGRRIQKGTGLGLSICVEILNKHHSTLDVQSSLGTGSTFSFLLPLGPG